jgi:hypothetical protein
LQTAAAGRGVGHVNHLRPQLARRQLASDPRKQHNTAKSGDKYKSSQSKLEPYPAAKRPNLRTLVKRIWAKGKWHCIRVIRAIRGFLPFS